MDTNPHRPSNPPPVINSDHHSCFSFGGLLPVLVVEAIPFEDLPLHSHHSLQITRDGWALLICGRKIFVWNFLTENSTKANSCYELDLPPSDLALRADHLALLPTLNASSPGLIAVSPEGFIRYWSNIAYDTACIECSVTDLNGQECALIHRVTDTLCIVATTTNTLIQVALGPSGINCRTLKPPQGMLSGFSKKFTSLIFGGGMTHSAESIARTFTKVFHISSASRASLIYSFSGSSMQKWHLESNYSEQLLMDMDLSRILKNSYLNVVLDSSDSAQSDLLIIDAASLQPFVIHLLVASALRPGNNDTFLALATLKDSDTFPGNLTLVSFKPIRNPKNLLRLSGEDQLLHMKLLFCKDVNSFAIYDASRVYFARNGNIIDSIDFDARDDALLGAGSFQETPLLFSIKEGLLSVNCNLLDFVEPAEVIPTDATDSTSVNEKKIAEIKRAVKLYSNDQRQEAIQLMTCLSDSSAQGASLLSALIYQFSSETLDTRSKELVAGKGRAFEHLLLLGMIEQKLNDVTKLIDLCKCIPQLSNDAVVTSPTGNVALLLALNDHLERLFVLHSLKVRQSDFYHLLHPALTTLSNSILGPDADLPDLDQFINVDFFLKASSVGDIIPCVIDCEEDSIKSPNFNPEELLQLLLSVSDLITEMFADVLIARNNMSKSLSASTKHSENFEPWDAVSSIRDSLLRHFDILSTKGFQLASTCDSNSQNKNYLLQKIYCLAEICLGSFKHQLVFLSSSCPLYHATNTSFEKARKSFISTFIHNGQHDKAMKLCEAFLDFDLLIELTERPGGGGEEALEKYMITFANQSFSTHLFQYYSKQKRLGKVVKSSKLFPSSLVESENELKWLHQIDMDDFSGAAVTLKCLNESENCLERQVTLLSLAKLSALAAATDTNNELISELDNQLYTVNYQILNNAGDMIDQED